jgi:hypothetical protein
MLPRQHFENIFAGVKIAADKAGPRIVSLAIPPLTAFACAPIPVCVFCKRLEGAMRELPGFSRFGVYRSLSCFALRLKPRKTGNILKIFLRASELPQIRRGRGLFRSPAET